MTRMAKLVTLALLLIGAAGLTAAAADAQTVGSPAVVKAAYNKTLKATILVDGSGRTLYLFTSDPKNVSTCAAIAPTCPKIWPAYAGKPTAGPGIKASLLATITGGTQVTYNGHPLYHFAGGAGYGAPDRKAGQVNGQGLFQVCYVVSPKGNAIRKQP